MNSDDREDKGEQSDKPARKAYEKPRLEVYGDLAEISKSLAGGTRNDGSGHPNKHFTN
jgi:hypothetical protein